MWSANLRSENGQNIGPLRKNCQTGTLWFLVPVCKNRVVYWWWWWWCTLGFSVGLKGCLPNTQVNQHFQHCLECILLKAAMDLKAQTVPFRFFRTPSSRPMRTRTIGGELMTVKDPRNLERTVLLCTIYTLNGKSFQLRCQLLFPLKI